MKTILIYDGSFKGLLTAVYTVFEKDVQDVIIAKAGQYAPALFTREFPVNTDPVKASGVWKSLRVKAGAVACDQLYRAFLSEVKGAENVILQYVGLVFSKEHFNPEDPGEACIKKISYAAAMVTRSEQRCYDYVCRAFKTHSGKWVSVQPDFNVLPLLAKRFREEKGGKAWVLYDRRRNYGFHYDTETLTPVFEAPVEEYESVPFAVLQGGVKAS